MRARTIIMALVLLAGCHEGMDAWDGVPPPDLPEHEPPALLLEADAGYDCADPCDVEAACNVGDPYYDPAADYEECVKECHAYVASADPAIQAIVACVFACTGDVEWPVETKGCITWATCIQGCS